MIKKLSIKLPRTFEQLEHLLGMMSVSTVVLFLFALYFFAPERFG